MSSEKEQNDSKAFTSFACEKISKMPLDCAFSCTCAIASGVAKRSPNPVVFYDVVIDALLEYRKELIKELEQ